MIRNGRGHLHHKSLLASRGWSYRTAARHLGVHWSHLNNVLQANRNSTSLLQRIENIPHRKEVDK